MPLFFYLLTNPKKLARLREEVARTMPRVSTAACIGDGGVIWYAYPLDDLGLLAPWRWW